MQFVVEMSSGSVSKFALGDALILRTMFSAQAMAIPFVCLGLADTKPASRRWLTEKFGGIAAHLFENNQCLTEGRGRCLFHRGQCSTSKERPDIASGGLPCQGFSRMRHKKGDTASTGQPSGHPSFKGVMSDFSEYLCTRQPLGWWIEEVDSFDQINPEIGISFLHQFVRQNAQYGYAIRAIILDHALFSEVPRRHIYCLGAGTEMGHAQGADQILKSIGEIVKFRQLTPPTPLFAVIDPDGPEELDRRDMVQEPRAEKIQYFSSYHPGSETAPKRLVSSICGIAREANVESSNLLRI